MELTPYPGVEAWAHMAKETSLHRPRALPLCATIRLIAPPAYSNADFSRDAHMNVTESRPF